MVKSDFSTDIFIREGIVVYFFEYINKMQGELLWICKQC